MQIPYMSGYGGNLVVLLPNSTTAFRFADAMSYAKESMILAAEAIRPLCSPTTVTTPAPRVPLSAGELGAELTGNTFYSRPARLFLDPSGTAYAVSRQNPIDVDVGRWYITEEGQYCRTWNVSDRARTRCYTVYREGDTFELDPLDPWGFVVLRRVLGYPQ